MTGTTESAGPPRDERLSGLELRVAWDALHRSSAEHPQPREAAHCLGVSEGELVASLVGERAVRLRTSGAAIIGHVPVLGPVTALTCNQHCLHGKAGPYCDIAINGLYGLALGDLIDLRLFPSRWHHTFAVIDDTPSGPRRSLQVFDADGGMVHKICEGRGTDIRAFDRLIEHWRAQDQSPVMDVWLSGHPGSPHDPGAGAAGRRGWEDVPEFFGPLRGLEAGRLRALRRAGREVARPVLAESLATVLEVVRDSAIPIMVLVGNPGCVQIHSGPVMNVERVGHCCSVTDPTFTLHLREDAIDSAWVVRRPTRDGEVASLEVFDAAGLCLTQVCGQGRPGMPPPDGWREVLEAVPDLK